MVVDAAVTLVAMDSGNDETPAHRSARPDVKTVGLFVLRTFFADMLWNQCDRPGGLHRGFRVVSGDRRADHILCIGPPVMPDGSPKVARMRRRITKWRGTYERVKAEHWFGSLGREPEDVTVLFYEPPTVVPDEWYDAAKRFAARVYGPDDRALSRLILPSYWTIDEQVDRLRGEPPGEKSRGLCAITSGTTWLAGHRERMGFIADLRAKGVPFDLYGRGLPVELGPLGAVRSKSMALRPSRLALVIENHADGDEYVTEKLWDALLCWCLPLYIGPSAPERIIPEQAIVRIPGYGADGVEAVRAAMADDGLWESRFGAIAEARRRALGELRIVEWLSREVPGLGAGRFGATAEAKPDDRESPNATRPATYS